MKYKKDKTKEYKEIARDILFIDLGYQGIYHLLGLNQFIGLSNIR